MSPFVVGENPITYINYYIIKNSVNNQRYILKTINHLAILMLIKHILI
jgi:hypothetical protein